ncbi:MAG: hypothetical protein ABSA47_00445 [Verrucomicrobiota bacterium]|jgi:sugar lactone lactonase YvrE
MKTKNYSILGALVAVLLAAVAQAQQVSTVISNSLLEPNSITGDPDNNVYFTDASNNRIVKFVPANQTQSTFAGVFGPSHAGYNNGPASAALFSQPLGIVYDTNRNGLVVVDQGNQVLRLVTTNGQVSLLAGSPGVYGPPNAGSVPATNAFFSFPTGIATDGTNLYVADAGNNAIRRLDLHNMVTTVIVTNYTFSVPEAVAVDFSNNLWVADTLNDTICLISDISATNNKSVTVVAGAVGQFGTNDSPQASLARFDKPSGLLWDPNGAGLFISDTANNTIRLLSQTSPSPPAYSVQTLVGVPGVAGYIDGAFSVAEFHNPVGLAVDTIDDGYYVVDRGNNALRRVQASPPQPPVSAPSIGFVNFVIDPQAEELVSQFNPSTYQVFSTNANIIINSEAGVQTYYTVVPTPTSPFSPVPVVGPGFTQDTYTYPGDDTPESDFTTNSFLQGFPTGATTSDVTIYAISQAPGRIPSPQVSSRFLFVTAEPTIAGNNSAMVPLTDTTPGAALYYTLNGTPPSPTNNANPGGVALNSPTTLSFTVTSNVTLTVEAFYDSFAPSTPATAIFNPSNYIPNQLTFGFANGEASSRFVGAAGHPFYAPITLTLLPAASMYSLQFNVTLAPTNTLGGAPPAASTSYTFNSMLLNQVTTPTGQTAYIVIPPAEYTNGGFQPLLFTNTSEGLLGVGWLELNQVTNLYFNGLKQDLITWSAAHETLFNSSGGQVIVGGYSFMIPASATTNGDAYQIQIGRPSAAYETGANGDTGPTENVVLDAPTTGSTGLGAINAVKNVIIGVTPYLVGDAYPFRWFNAGDFGDTNLQNDDVVEVFRAAVYGGAAGDLPGSDFFDAMDSSNGRDNNLYDGNDTAINSIAYGDGSLNVDDIYVTFRRSLDPALTNYERFWSNGLFYAQTVPSSNPSRLVATGPATSSPIRAAETATASGPRQITVAADRVQAAAGQTVQVPIRVLAADPVYPIRVLALNVDLIPLDGSPAVTNTITLSPGAGLGAPAFTLSQGADNYAATWLDSTVSGVNATNIIATVTVTLPPNANTNSSYLLHFEHFSASPNGIALFQTTIQDGLITVGGDRSASSWNDGIPDWWRLVYFGTVSNLLSAADLDPDGDGASNWQEYVAGTNPLDPKSVLEVSPSANFTIQWPSVYGKTYALETSTSLFSTNWTVLSSNLPGTGQTMQIQDTNLPAPPARFYRVVVH